LRAHGDELLIIQTAFVGDLLLSVPLLKELRATYEGAKITVLCRRGLGDFLLRSQLADEVVEADKSSKADWQNAVRILRQKRFALLLCPHQSPRSRFLAWRLHAKRKIGYRSLLGNFVFDQQVIRPMALPEAVRQLALLEPLDAKWHGRMAEIAGLQDQAGGQVNGGLIKIPTWADMSIPILVRLRADFRQTGMLRPVSSLKLQDLMAELGLRPERKTVFLAPGSVWKTKMWNLDSYTKVARAYLARGDRVIIIGAPNEAEICAELARRAPGAVSIAGRCSLFESAELMCAADLLICNDSGAMHMAATVGVPLVTVFGPTILDFGYRPWTNQALVAQLPDGELQCRPCGSHGGNVCPIGTHECMKRITADEVLRKAEDLIN
jgi:heptosyltransferase-2